MQNSYGYESYRGRSGLQTALTVLVVLLLIALLAAVAFFFFAQQYIVYDDEGKAHLELPFFQTAEAAPTPAPTPTQGYVIVETTAPTPEPTPEPVRGLEVVALPLTALTDGTAAQQVAAAGGSAALFDMKSEEGRLGYVSGQRFAITSGMSAAESGLNDAIAALNAGALYTIARVSCFKDNETVYYFGRANGLRTGGGNWRDADGSRWFSPAAQGARDYITGVCVELCELGFDELWLDWCTFPTRGKLSSITTGDNYDKESFAADLEGFYAQVRAALEPYPDVKLSFTTTCEALTGTDALSGQSAGLLGKYADRLYVAGPETEQEAQALYKAVTEELGMDPATQLILTSPLGYEHAPSASFSFITGTVIQPQ